MGGRAAATPADSGRSPHRSCLNTDGLPFPCGARGLRGLSPYHSSQEPGLELANVCQLVKILTQAAEPPNQMQSCVCPHEHFEATANARSADSGGAGCLLGTTGLQKGPEGMTETCVQPGPLEEERGL